MKNMNYLIALAFFGIFTGFLISSNTSIPTPTLSISEATPKRNYSIDSHRAIEVTQTSAALLFTASQNVQAYVQYGTTQKYGEQTKLEESFNYSTHRQKMTGLTPDTTYYYKIHTTNEAGMKHSTTGSFTTE